MAMKGNNRIISPLRSIVCSYWEVSWHTNGNMDGTSQKKWLISRDPQKGSWNTYKVCIKELIEQLVHAHVIMNQQIFLLMSTGSSPESGTVLSCHLQFPLICTLYLWRVQWKQFTLVEYSLGQPMLTSIPATSFSLEKHEGGKVINIQLEGRT